MAWKFNNPWDGGNAQNPWDIQGQEAEKALNIGNDVLNSNSSYETSGFFIQDITEEQIKTFREKIMSFFSGISVGYTFDKQTKKGRLYRKGLSYDGTDFCLKIIDSALDKKVNLINKTKNEVDVYDQFKGAISQWINIEQFNHTNQKEYFILAITHVVTEYLTAVKLQITDVSTENFLASYNKAHLPTLRQDLLVYDQLVRYKDTKWNWFQDLNDKGIVNSKTTFVDGGNQPLIFINQDILSNIHLFKYNAETDDQEIGTVKYNYFEFVNPKSFIDYMNSGVTANDYSIIKYDKITF